MKNLEELKNNEKIQEILDQKVIKKQRHPKTLKDYSPLLLSEKTQQKELPNTIINDGKYVI